MMKSAMSSSDRVVQELPWLRRLAQRLAAMDAEDLVQDTWLMATRDRPVPRGPSGLRPWLAQAMRNRSRSLGRSSATRRRREAHWAPPEVDEGTPERQAMRADIIRVLEQALATLRDDERVLLQERFFHDRSPTQIAAQLGIPAATVRTRIRRSLLQLRAVLDERHGDDRSRWAPAFVALPLARRTMGGLIMASAKGFLAAGAILGVVALLWSHVSDTGTSDGKSSDASAGEHASPAGYEAQPLLDPDDADPGTTRTGRPPPRSKQPSSLPPLVLGSRVGARECATTPREHDCAFVEPDGPVIEEMARCGVVRYDFPAMFAQHDWTPEFEQAWLQLIGATPEESERLAQIGDAYRDELFADLEALAAELDLDPWPSDVTLLTAVVDLSVAVGDDAVEAASRIVAHERAGWADPPASVDELPAAERFVRLFTDVGNAFESKIAEQLGDARARELRLANDGWPGVKAHTGARCPD